MDIPSHLDHFPIRLDSMEHFYQQDMSYHRVDDAERNRTESFPTNSRGSIAGDKSNTQDLKSPETWPTGKEEGSLQIITDMRLDAKTHQPQQPGLSEQLLPSRDINPICRTNLDKLTTRDSTVKSNSLLAEIEAKIDEMLRIPLSPASLRFSGLNGRPLGVEVAINAYWRGECSTGTPDRRLIPAKLRKSLSSVPEEQTRLQSREIEEGIELSEAWTSSNTLSGIDKISCEFYEPQPRDPIQSVLSASKQNSWKVSGSPAADVRSMAGSIHNVDSLPPPTFPPPNKPLPALPISAEENQFGGCGHNAALERPPFQGLTRRHDNVLRTCRFDLPYGVNDSQISLPKERLLQSRLDTSHFAFTPANVEPAEADKHPLFRKRQQDRPTPLRISATHHRLREFALPSPIPQHRKFLSVCSEYSMVSPSRPPSGTPSSYLCSLPESPAPPSDIASDPGPVRSNSIRLSNFHSRASLDETGPNSPFLPKPFLAGDVPDKTAAQMYAEEIEGLHGLSRQVSLAERALPQPLPYDDEWTPNPEESQANLRIRDFRYPMKTKRSVLKRLSMIQRERMERAETASLMSNDRINEAVLRSPSLSSLSGITKHDYSRSTISLVERKPFGLMQRASHERRFKTLKAGAQSVEKVHTQIVQTALFITNIY